MLPKKYKVKSIKTHPESQTQSSQQPQHPKNPSPPQQQQQQIVYFRLRAPADQDEPEQEFIVNRYPNRKFRVKCQGDVQERKVERRGDADGDDEKEKDGQEGKEKEKQKQRKEKEEKQQKDDLKEVEDMFSEMNLKKSVQYFLKRVEDICPVNPNQTEVQIHKDKQFQRSNKLSSYGRELNREQLFAKSRGIEPTLKRVKIIDFSQQYVQLGLQKIPVQNLGNLKDYYYILSKRQTIKPGPQISLPATSSYLFNKIQFQQQLSSSSQMADQDEDSNRESNPDYDYPEEDYRDDEDGEGDQEDQGVLCKEYYPGWDEEQEYGRNQSDCQLDQEEVYRRYLKRCKDDKNKYDDDDDQYY